MLKPAEESLVWSTFCWGEAEESCSDVATVVTSGSDILGEERFFGEVSNF